ncbi:MAG: PaaI family thioesterase [Candidatus Heimdallarchaeota archaeon]|nr:PaaI family thioesterase [Candidatus Heimdallarchaeota archaeon]
MSNPNVDLLKKMIGTNMEHGPSNTGKWLAGKLLHVERGNLQVEYIVNENMLNPAKLLHGGIIATMLDEIIGATVYSLGMNTFFTTINITVDFFKPALLGDKLIAKTGVVKEGKTIIHMKGELYKGDNLIATAHSNLIDTGKPFN